MFNFRVPDEDRYCSENNHGATDVEKDFLHSFFPIFVLFIDLSKDKDE
jgi:hypothetical protein